MKGWLQNSSKYSSVLLGIMIILTGLLSPRKSNYSIHSEAALTKQSSVEKRLEIPCILVSSHIPTCQFKGKGRVAAALVPFWKDSGFEMKHLSAESALVSKLKQQPSWKSERLSLGDWRHSLPIILLTPDPVLTDHLSHHPASQGNSNFLTQGGGFCSCWMLSVAVCWTPLLKQVQNLLKLTQQLTGWADQKSQFLCSTHICKHIDLAHL